MVGTTEQRNKRAARVCEFAMQENILPDLRWYPAYSEPGYDEPEGLILSADWNKRTRWNRETRRVDVIDRRPERIARILERLGCALEWCDEWTDCSDCGGALRTQPDGWSWKPAWKWADDCTIVCLECWDEDEHRSTDGAR